VAAVLDFLLWLAVMVTLLVISVIVMGSVGGDASLNWFNATILAVLIVVVYGSLLAYGIFFEMVWNGQTPGKRAAGVRVVRQGGAPIDLRSSCIRNLLRPADLLPACYLLGAIFVLLTPRRQRLGDLAAGTVVIRERVAAPPDVVEEVVGLYVSDEFHFTPQQLQAITAADRQVLRSYFLRLRQMDSMAARGLAESLAETFANKMGPDPTWPAFDEGIAEGFLASLYRDLGAWKRR
jgi:uncharacterized RDD family membrane protein YckC